MNLSNNIHRKIILFRTVFESAMYVVGVFLSIFVYKYLGSVELTLLGTFISFFGIFISFPIFNYFASKYSFKIEKNIFLAIGFAVLSVTPLLFGTNLQTIFLFLFIYGLSQGFAWCGINTMELVKVEDHEKREYISVVGLYRKMLSVLIPLGLSGLFVLFADFTYTIIFFLSTFLYLCSYFLFGDLYSYKTEKLNFQDIRHFWSAEKNFKIHLYYFLEGFTHILAGVLNPLAAFLLLKSETNVGLLTGAASLFSILLMYMAIDFRRGVSMGKMYLYVTLVYFPFILLFAYLPNITTFLIYTIVGLLVLPQLSVSSHNVTLYTMEEGKRPGKDFFGNMLFREVDLFLGRLLATCVFLGILIFQGKNFFILSTGFIVLAFIFIFRAYIGGQILKNFESK